MFTQTKNNSKLIPNSRKNLFDGSIVDYGNSQKYFRNFATGSINTFRIHLDNIIEISDNLAIQFQHSSGEFFLYTVEIFGPQDELVHHFDVAFLVKNVDGDWEPVMYFHTDTVLQKLDTHMENVRGGGWASELLEKYQDISTFQKIYETLYSCLLKFGRDTAKPTDNVFQWLKDSKFIGEFMTYLMSREDKKNLSDIV